MSFDGGDLIFKVSKVQKSKFSFHRISVGIVECLRTSKGINKFQCIICSSASPPYGKPNQPDPFTRQIL